MTQEKQGIESVENEHKRFHDEWRMLENVLKSAGDDKKEEIQGKINKIIERVNEIENVWETDFMKDLKEKKQFS